MRVLWCGVLMLAATMAGAQETLKPMAKSAKPAFEVATIKPSAPDDNRDGFHLSGHRLFIENETLVSMIMLAYEVHAKQIVGVPAWAGTERLDVQGTPDTEGQPSFPQQQEMIRKLLEDRFGLRFHREQREMAIFALTVAKGGAKMARSASAVDDEPDSTGNGDASTQTVKFTNQSMRNFALVLQYLSDKPVVDQTGLAGRYDFTLKWAPNVLPDAAAGVLPGLQGAVQEQLGLKLEATKGMAEVLVVDGVKRPSVD